MTIRSRYITSRRFGPGRAPNLVCGVPLAAAAACAMFATPVAAQTAVAGSGAPALATVHVEADTSSSYKVEKASSPKFTQSLVDTPQTITVITKEVMQERAATTLTDVLRNVPGITFQMGESGMTVTGDAIFLRGSDTSGSIFVDGMRDVSGLTRDMFNIDRVEVVKGPAGADIGRGAPTGYINLVTKQPTNTNSDSASISVGTAGRLRTTYDFNRLLGSDGSTAFRLNLMGQNGGVDGRDYVRNKGGGFAPSLAFGLGTATRTFLSWQHSEQRDRPDGGLPTVGLQGAYSPQLASIGGNAARVDSRNYYGSLSDHDNSRSDVVSIRFEHDFAGGLTLSNATRWEQVHQDLTLVGPFGTTLQVPRLSDPASWNVRVVPQGKIQDNRLISNQTNLTGELGQGWVRHDITTGLEFSSETQRSGAYTTAGLSGPRATFWANLYDPDPHRTPVQLLAPTALAEGQIKTAAFYFFDTIKLGQQWQILAGVRAEHYSTDDVGVNSVAGQMYTGKLGVVYKPAQHASVYAVFANSALPPGSNFTFYNPAIPTLNGINNFNLKPQKAQTFEVGGKWDALQQRLLMTAAVFHTTNKNQAVTTDSLTDAVTQFGKTQVNGVELGATGKITRNWQIIAGLSMLDARVLEGPTSQTGAVPQYTPKHSATLWSTYRLSHALTFGIGARYLSTQTVTTSSQPRQAFSEVPSYAVYDAMASYRFNRNLSLQLNLNNLTNKFYVDRVNANGNRYIVGAARSAMVTANITF